MINLSVFINAKIENNGWLALMGDTGLTPFRYLFNGKTFLIEPSRNHPIEVHRVASFHRRGEWNYIRTLHTTLTSSSTSMLKTILSVVFLVPGLIIGSALKGLAYLFEDVKTKHQFAKESLKPKIREIGTIANPIKDIKELEEALKNEWNKDAYHRPTTALVIHGDGNLTINEDPGILRFNPMKLILEGAAMVHKPSATGRLDDAMFRTGKWNTKAVRFVTAENTDATFVNSKSVKTVDEALSAEAPRRSWTSCKRVHMIYELPRPQLP